MRLKSCALGVVVSVGVAAMPCYAVSVPPSDLSYIPMTDMVTFNWQVLEISSGGAIQAPDLPTGNLSEPYIRIFSNGSLTGQIITPVKFQDDKQPNAGNPLGKFNEGQQAGLWYGLEWSDDPQDPQGDPTGVTVTRVLRASEILTVIQALDPGSVTPIWALDQNQNNTAPGSGDCRATGRGPWRRETSGFG